MTHIAIIGAGIAGLSCANRLRAAGVGVALFDKARGPGGRVSTRRAENWQFDHGAQFFKARDPRFREQVAAWEATSIVSPWKPRVIRVNAEGDATTEVADDLWVGTPRMTAISRDLEAGLEIHYTTRVKTLEQLDHGWLLVNEAGGRHGPFGKVLLTCPAPQTAELLGELTPLTERVLSARMLPCWAVMAAFDRPLAVAFEAARVERGPLSWVARNTSKPGRADTECWVLHADHNWTTANLDRPRDEAGSDLLEAFADLTGDGATPVYTAVHRWLYAKPEASLGAPCLWDGERGLGCAGDWCLAPNVEGAWLSGLALAETIGSA